MSPLPSHPKDHPIIQVIQNIDSEIRSKLIDRDRAMATLDTLCSDEDGDARYYAAWYVIHHFKNTSLHDKASQILIEPLAKLLDDTEPGMKKIDTQNDELIRYFERVEIINEFERIGSLLAVPHLKKLFSDTEKYDGWGVGVYLSVSDFAHSAIEMIELKQKESSEGI